MIWLKLQSEKVRVEKEYLIWPFNPRESKSQRDRDTETDEYESKESTAKSGILSLLSLSRIEASAKS